MPPKPPTPPSKSAPSKKPTASSVRPYAGPPEKAAEKHAATAKLSAKAAPAQVAAKSETPPAAPPVKPATAVAATPAPAAVMTAAPLTQAPSLTPAKTATAVATGPAPAQSDYRIHDPEAFARNMLRVFEDGNKFMSTMMERSLNKPQSKQDMSETTTMMTNIATSWVTDPQKLATAQTNLYRGYIELWQGSMRRLLGEQVAPVAKPDASDNRFKDGDWSANPYFDYWKQAYLLTTRWAETQLAETKGLDDSGRAKAEFYLRQLSSAMSPTNFPATNPEVMRETLATNGQNLVTGMEQLLADVEKSGDVFKISQTDTTAFDVGRNLAVTPGKIVYQNDILQLIQYTPTSGTVRDVPLLIVPPWINKFYILDLTQPKSFIKYVVDQGFTVFVVSWVNPDGRLADKTFEDYMREGILSAANAVTRETGVPKINVVGYCVGGTLLASTLAYLAARGDDPFASATFLTTQVDFTKAGDLKLFIDDKQLSEIAATMAETGYLDGARMATVFNMLRPKDLIWPYVVNNYMMGKKPMPFDLLYWNQDSTRMPAANHNFYLREFYHENKLAKGEMVLANTKLDLSKVKLPIYELAAREDHIAPAESVYIGSRMFGGPVEYVMAGSGHIAGVVNPPDPKKVKYQYWTNPAKPESHAEWAAGAVETPGSWWPHWIRWLTAKSGGMVTAREPGRKLGVLEDAPGSYVRAKG
jgi:polyhydroxyalkanoate synthase subunit PhaC